MDTDVVAWWEEESGMWLLTRAPKTPQSLVAVWSDLVGPPGALLDQLGPQESKEGALSNEGTPLTRYAVACELLFQVLECLLVSALP